MTPEQFEAQMESWNMCMVKLMDQLADLADKKEQLLDQFVNEWADDVHKGILRFWTINVASYRDQGPEKDNPYPVDQDI